MKIGYADPPYPGCAHLYKDHEDYAGEVNHKELIARLERDYDGWVLHTSSTALRQIIELLPKNVRIMAWVKGFAAFKKNVSVAYAWEPVIVKAARKPVVSKRIISRDWIECSMTLKKGLTGVKPEAVCHWAFEMVGARPEDDLDDMFPGTGAVSVAWNTWKKLFVLPENPSEEENMSHRPEIIDRYLDIHKTVKPLNNELESLKPAVRDILEDSSYPDIYVTKPAKTKEIDAVQALELAKEYLAAGLLKKEQFESLFVKVINPDEVWKLIRSGVLQPYHLWLPKNGTPEPDKNGIKPRRVVYYSQKTPSIIVPDKKVQE